MRKIKVVLLLVRQLQHGFTKNAKVSPNVTVAHKRSHNSTVLNALRPYYRLIAGYFQLKRAGDHLQFTECLKWIFLLVAWCNTYFIRQIYMYDVCHYNAWYINISGRSQRGIPLECALGKPVLFCKN